MPNDLSDVVEEIRRQPMSMKRKRSQGIRTISLPDRTIDPYTSLAYAIIKESSNRLLKYGNMTDEQFLFEPYILEYFIDMFELKTSADTLRKLVLGRVLIDT